MTMAIIRKMPAREYHADPAPEPSLSNSIAQKVLDDSPFHAWFAHPRLNPDRRQDDEGSRVMAVGSAAHKLALDAGETLAVLDFADYRKKDAQEQRDAAYADGKVPILGKDYERAKQQAGPLREAAENYLGCDMSDALREHVVMWEEDGCWRRIMVDAMRPDYTAMVDLKTTVGSVAPHSLARKVYADNYHLQTAFYLRGMDALDPGNAGRRVWAFIFSEQNAPHAISPPIELSEGGIELGRQQVDTACKLWDSCMRARKWPCYSSDVYVAEPPSFIVSAWQMRHEGDETLNPIAWTAEQLYGRSE